MLCMFYFSFWFELSPSPGLLWYDSYATGPSVFPLKRRPSFLSGKRRGSSYGVYDFQFSFFPMTMLRVVRLIFMPGVWEGEGG